MPFIPEDINRLVADTRAPLTDVVRAERLLYFFFWNMYARDDALDAVHAGQSADHWAALCDMIYGREFIPTSVRSVYDVALGGYMPLLSRSPTNRILLDEAQPAYQRWSEAETTSAQTGPPPPGARPRGSRPPVASIQWRF